VFKSFKSYFSKACSKYLAKNPGVVITTDKLAALVAEAWPNAFSAINIISGFKKTGVYPLNPGEVNDRQLAPSKALLCPKTGNVDNAKTTPTPGSPLFSPEQEALYQKRFDENYDISDPSYVAWLKINHPEAELNLVLRLQLELHHHLVNIIWVLLILLRILIHQIFCRKFWFYLNQKRSLQARGNRLLLRKLCALLKMTC